MAQTGEPPDTSENMYENAAQKQKAYRDRLRAQGLVLAPPRPKATKPPSRPARLTTIEGALRTLATEYNNWLDALPANLSESRLAEQLLEFAENLEALADKVGDLDPPRIGLPSHDK